MVARSKTRSKGQKLSSSKVGRQGARTRAVATKTRKTTSRKKPLVSGVKRSATKSKTPARSLSTGVKKTTAKASTRSRISKMSLEEAGRKGGEARAQKYSKAQLSEQAKRGAKTIERSRPGFHSRIGQKGGEARGRSR
jgi:hypothetical protein